MFHPFFLYKKRFVTILTERKKQQQPISNVSISKKHKNVKTKKIGIFCCLLNRQNRKSLANSKHRSFHSTMKKFKEYQIAYNSQHIEK